MNRGLLAGAIAALVSTSVFAQAKEVTIGYRDMVVPYRMAQEAKGPQKRRLATRSTGNSSAVAAR